MSAVGTCHTQPAWTPVGNQIVFCRKSWRADRLGFSLANARGGERNSGKRKEFSRSTTPFRTRPHAHGCKRIVYSPLRARRISSISFTCPGRVGGVPYKLTFRFERPFSPRWSPDGEWIALYPMSSALPSCDAGNLRRRAQDHPDHRRILEAPDGQTFRAIVTIHRAAWFRPASRALAADGKFYAPVELSRGSQSQETTSFTQRGQFEAEVPPGEMTIEAWRGPEYWPSTAKVRIIRAESLAWS